MINKIHYYLQAPQLIMMAVVIGMFFTIISIAAPLLSRNKLKARLHSVTNEKDKLRSAQRANFNAAGEAKLREKVTGRSANFVEKLNLRSLLQVEASRVALKNAGMRSEKQVVTFLAARAILPVILGLIAFVYSMTVLANIFSTPALKLFAMLGGVVLGFYLPLIILANIAKRRQASIKGAWSDALDLLLICIESGMSVEVALQRVAKEIGSRSVPLAEEMALTIAELSYLQDRRKAFENLATRTNLPTVKAVVTSLIQSEQYGTPLSSALRALAQENRDTRMQEAERKAAALSPKLTVPMILFFLPVVFVIIGAPPFLDYQRTTSGNPSSTTSK